MLFTNLSLTAPYSCNLLEPRWHFITTIARPGGFREGCMDIVMHSSAPPIILRNLHRLHTNYPWVNGQWFHFCFHKTKVNIRVYPFNLENKTSLHMYIVVTSMTIAMTLTYVRHSLVDLHYYHFVEIPYCLSRMGSPDYCIQHI